MAMIQKSNYSEKGLNTPNFAPRDPKVETTGSRMFLNIGDTTSEVAGQLEKAHALGEETKAKNLYHTEQAQILSEAAQEVELTPEKQKTYTERLQKALNGAADSISIPEYRGLFKQNYSTKADIADLKVQSIFLRKYRDQARAEFQKSKAQQGMEYVTTNNVNEKSMYISELNSDIEAQVSSGYMTKEQGEKEKLKTVELWNKNHMKNDLETRPQWLLEEAQKGEKGFYAGVNPAFRSNLIEQAKKRVHSLDIINRNNNENEMMKKQISGALTPEEIEESFLNKSISRTFYEKMNKAIDSPTGPTGNTDPATFYDLTNKLVQPETSPEMAREKLLEAHAEGKLSFEDFKKLYSMHLLPTEEGPQSLTNILGPKAQGDFATIKALHDAQNKQLTDKKNGWHSVFKMIDKTLDDDQEAVNSARQKLYDRMGKGDVTDLHGEAGKVLFDQFKTSHPEISKFPKEGKVMMLGGKKWRYYPDKMPEEVK